MSLHDEIMRLPCTPPADANINQGLAYKSGHRDARHAAAELAAGAEADRRELLEALELADCMLSGANMNHSVVERTVRAAIAKARGN